MQAQSKVREMIMNKNLAKKKEKTRTSATVSSTKLALFKIVAGLKFDEDPMNNAWEESVDLFLKENEMYLKELDIEIKDLLKK